MAAVLSPRPPMHNWHGMAGQTPLHSWQPQMSQYQPPTTISDYPPNFVAPVIAVQGPPTPAGGSNSSASRRPSTSHGPTLSDTAWTSDMDDILIDAQSRGMKWEQIAKEYFPMKSATASRKRFGRAKEERKVSDWDDRRISNLVLAYNRDGVREKMWSVMAQETGEGWQNIERLCFAQGFVKMTRKRGGQGRRSSRQKPAHLKEDSKRNSSSTDEYDTNDDSGIGGVGLGLESNHAYRHGAIGQVPVSNGQPVESLLHPSHTHHYLYRR